MNCHWSEILILSFNQTFNKSTGKKGKGKDIPVTGHAGP
jgi:hypothetical protein